MDNPESFTFIEGKTIDLVPLNSEHFKIYTSWFNNPKVRKYLFGDLRYRLPNTLEEIKKWFEPQQDGLKDKIHFEIWHKNDNKPLGLIGLAYIDWIDRWGVAYIFIGDTDYWGHNIAGETTELLFKYAFNEINLNKISAWIAVENKPSQNAAKKVGFIFEGKLKQWLYIDGKYVDVKCFRLLKEEWIKK
jgi:RimJ/RimL family protein N-acetyltransferase